MNGIPWVSTKILNFVYIFFFIYYLSFGHTLYSYNILECGCRGRYIFFSRVCLLHRSKEKDPKDLKLKEAWGSWIFCLHSLIMKDHHTARFLLVFSVDAAYFYWFISGTAIAFDDCCSLFQICQPICFHFNNLPLQMLC